MVGPGRTRLDGAGQDGAAGIGGTYPGEEWSGPDRHGRHVKARPGPARAGSDKQWFDRVRPGKDKDGQGRQVKARLGRTGYVQMWHGPNR